MTEHTKAHKDFHRRCADLGQIAFLMQEWTGCPGTNGCISRAFIDSRVGIWPAVRGCSSCNEARIPRERVIRITVLGFEQVLSPKGTTANHLPEPSNGRRRFAPERSSAPEPPREKSADGAPGHTEISSNQATKKNRPAVGDRADEESTCVSFV